MRGVTLLVNHSRKFLTNGTAARYTLATVFAVWQR